MLREIVVLGKQTKLQFENKSWHLKDKGEGKEMQIEEILKKPIGRQIDF